nr:hypothetical protein Q903MT_gene3133 [Picea sitchensis]
MKSLERIFQHSPNILNLGRIAQPIPEILNILVLSAQLSLKRIDLASQLPILLIPLLNLYSSHPSPEPVVLRILSVSYSIRSLYPPRHKGLLPACWDLLLVLHSYQIQQTELSERGIEGKRNNS